MLWWGYPHPVWNLLALENNLFYHADSSSYCIAWLKGSAYQGLCLGRVSGGWNLSIWIKQTSWPLMTFSWNKLLGAGRCEGDLTKPLLMWEKSSRDIYQKTLQLPRWNLSLSKTKILNFPCISFIKILL